MVKCKFCLQQMSEVDMISHVYYDHKISGIFSSVGGENVRKNDVTTSTVSIQTGENFILAPTNVLQREQEQERDEQERDHRGQGLGQGQGPCEQDKDQDEQGNDQLRSNSIRETENSDTNNSYQEIDDAFTLIKVAKSPPETVKKKVTFSDMTNYYPISKRKRLKRRAREPLLLGANTTLKYLKYWGTTNKPDC